MALFEQALRSASPQASLPVAAGIAAGVLPALRQVLQGAWRQRHVRAGHRRARSDPCGAASLLRLQVILQAACRYVLVLRLWLLRWLEACPSWRHPSWRHPSWRIHLAASASHCCSSSACCPSLDSWLQLVEPCVPWAERLRMCAWMLWASLCLWRSWPGCYRRWPECDRDGIGRLSIKSQPPCDGALRLVVVRQPVGLHHRPAAVGERWAVRVRRRAELVLVQTCWCWCSRLHALRRRRVRGTNRDTRSRLHLGRMSWLRLMSGIDALPYACRITIG